MAYFNFQRLIAKYSREFTVTTLAAGSYNDKGDYVDGEATETTLKGAIIGYKESKIYRSEGTLTAKDKRLFLLQPLDRALLGAKIVFNGEKYSIEAESENAVYTGVYAYTLKYVSAFQGG